MFKCRLAHFTGQGLSPQEVLFVVSSEDVVELHSFSHGSNTNGDHQTPAVHFKFNFKYSNLII
jgi:hypothetical protein